MHHGMQDLLGEVARLRAEVQYVLRLLDDLERVPVDRHYLHEYEHDEIVLTTRHYSDSARENLERVADNLTHWRLQVETVMQ